MRRLTQSELKSILLSTSFWIICAGVAVARFGMAVSFARYTQLYMPHPDNPQLVITIAGASKYYLFIRAIAGSDFILPLACSLAVGASFATDRKTRVAQYVLTRGFRKWQYLLAKAVAMMLCSMLLIAIVQGVAWIVSVILARYPTVQPWELVGGSARTLDNLLFHHIPGQYVLRVGFLQVFAAASIATVPLLIAALGGNAWVSTIGTLLLWVLAEYACNGNTWAFLYPGFRVQWLWWNASSGFRILVACPSFLRSSFAYWGIFLLLNVGFAAFIYLRQEDA